MAHIFSAADSVFGGGRSYQNLLKSFMFIFMPRFIRLLAGKWHVSWFYHQHKNNAGETRLEQFSRQRERNPFGMEHDFRPWLAPLHGHPTGSE
jgi:hypothetical protein